MPTLFLSMALILAHIPTYRSQINIQTNACTFCTGTVFVWAASVTYQLCHMYVRADKMASYASPAYLADHCGERGKLDALAYRAVQ